MKYLRRSGWCILLLGVVNITSCGGGAAGANFVGAAEVTLRVQPSRLDTGDRTEVSVHISNVHPDGIALKFRYPDGLRYVPLSAKLLLPSMDIDIVPTVNTASPEREVFLVFYLEQDLFRERGREYRGEPGIVALQLEGIRGVGSGTIAVDADVDDPEKPNAQEFDIESPQFTPEAEVTVEVVG